MDFLLFRKDSSNRISKAIDKNAKMCYADSLTYSTST